MATKHYKLDVSSTEAYCESFIAALKDKYGDKVTIYNNSSSAFTFYCAAISHRWIRQFYHPSEGSGFTSFSDQMWSDEVVVLYADMASLDERLILGDSFMMVASANDGDTRRLCIIGKTEGSKSVFCGFNSRNYSSRIQVSFMMTGDASTKRDISIVSVTGNAFWEPGVPCMTGLLFAYNEDGQNFLLRKDDGTPDTITGLYMSTYSPAEEFDFLLTNKGFLSPRSMTTNGNVQLPSSIVAEL